MLPKDPIILLSTVNTRLRDNYSSIEALCLAEDTTKEAIDSRLEPLGYKYDPEQNAYK